MKTVDVVLVSAAVSLVTAVLTGLLTAYLQRRHLLNERRLRHMDSLYQKKLAGCEELWRLLESCSFSGGHKRVVRNSTTNPEVQLKPAQELYESLTKVFFESHGLFFSIELRDRLFGLREHLKELVGEEDNQEVLRISKTRRDKFRSTITNLHKAIRAEVGLADLRLSDGPKL